MKRVVAATLALLLMLLVLVFVTPAPASAQVAPPVPPGTLLPPIPPSVVVTGTEMAVGGTAAGGGAAAGAASCGAVTGGTCLVVAATAGTAFMAAYSATSWALHTFWPRKTPEPGIVLASNYVMASRPNPCSMWQRKLELMPSQNPDMPHPFPPADQCVQFGWAAGAFPYSNGRVLANITNPSIFADGGGLSSWQFIWKANTRAFSLSSWFYRHCHSGSYCGLRPTTGNSLTESGSGLTQVRVDTENLGMVTGAEACLGSFALCGLNPAATMTVSACTSTTTGCGSSTTIYDGPAFPELAETGTLVRFRSSVQCGPRGSTSTSTTETAYTQWVWERDAETDMDEIKLPQCQAPLIPRRVEIWRSLAGLGEVLNWSTNFGTEWDEIPEICRGTADCTPTVEPETETEPERCLMGGVQVAAGWCDRHVQAEVEDPDREHTGTTVSDLGPPQTTPPTLAEPPEDDDDEEDDTLITNTPLNPDPDSGDCLPNGWGLFNPIDWVVKPVKCVFQWAFVPKVPLGTRMTEVQTAASGSGIGTITGVVTDFQDVFEDSAGPVDPGGGGGGASCEGPRMVFFGEDYYPFSACSDPMATWATWFRNLLAASVVVLGAVLIYNRIVAPLGIEPIKFRDG